MSVEPPEDDPSSVYVATDLKVAMSDALASAALETFRAGDESTCIWVDQKTPHRVWVSFGLATDDLELAMSEGLAQAGQLRDLLQREARTTQVTAYTESAQMQWTPED